MTSEEITKYETELISLNNELQILQKHMEVNMERIKEIRNRIHELEKIITL